MKDKTILILEQVKAGTLTPQEAQDKLFVLFGITGCFTVGAKVKITKCIHGHGFEIGEIVTIIEREDDGDDNGWYCTNAHGVQWYITEDEGVPLVNDNGTQINKVANYE